MDILEKIKGVVLEAGDIIREGFSGEFNVEFKTGEGNLVTEIDKKAENAILDFIKKEFPTHSVLAEESGNNFKQSDYCWVIDPLDGTTNFTHGLPIFSVSIGLRKKDETIIGIIYDVMRDTIYATEKGSGAYENSKKIKVSGNTKLSRSLLVTGFPYDLRENPGNIMDVFVDFTMNSRAVRRLGSAAIDLCYVASGVFDGFWENNLAPWDICAGQLLVEEAGGLVTDFKNKKMDIFSKEILATNGQIHETMLRVINNH